MPDEEDRATDAVRSASPAAHEVTEAEIIETIEDGPRRPDDAVPVSPPVRRRSGSLAGAVLGGILAAGCGFALARIVPGGWPVQDTSALTAQIAAQANEIASLKTDLTSLANRPVPDPSAEIATLRAGLEERLAESSAAVDPAPAIAAVKGDLQGTIAALDARLTEVEKRPVGADGGASPTALAAFEREIQALRDQVAAGPGANAAMPAQIETAVNDAKAQLADATKAAEQLKADAAKAGRAAVISVALGRIRAALDGGGPYTSALDDLQNAGVEVPADLAALAATGIPSLADMQRRFPDAARQALEAALRATASQGGWGDRVASFFRVQTGARSLTPRDGDDPDAVLSRAGAAVDAGNIADALVELAKLPDAVQAPLAPWIADARARESAKASVAALAAAADVQ